MKNIIGKTESVCPVCLGITEAYRVLKKDGVYLEKYCPAHGYFSTLIWEGDLKSYLAWDRGNRKKDKITGAKPSTGTCPYDCGLCTDHIRSGCCVLLELTGRCNLKCPVCFASSGENVRPDPTIDEIGGLMDMLMEKGGPYNLQLSGGEPTMRDDLPQIIKLGLEKGFTFFQLNTNGLRLAREPEYAKSLKAAGLSCVFLQFDSLRDSVYKTLRGKPILREKLTAIKNCEKAGLGVVLVPVIAPGINDSEIGAILSFAEKHMPAVRGVHFQPISYFGRCIEETGRRITIPFMIREIERQTHGRMKASDFGGGGAENPYCSFHASYLKQPDGRLKPLPQKGGCCCGGGATSKQSRENVARQWKGSDGKSAPEGTMDAFINETLDNTLAISGMLFQDAYNLDLDRLKRCYICETDKDFGMVPFCAYNLTSTTGKSIYRR